MAGRYAAAEARTALEAGLHVLLFSDNVPLEDEITLKKLAVEHGLLCMGPDAGTAIINGVALGFANAVPRGQRRAGQRGRHRPAGRSPAGIARRGAGVSQAIGTGGRDLSEAVGGAMMLAGLRMLQEDPDTGGDRADLQAARRRGRRDGAGRRSSGRASPPSSASSAPIPAPSKKPGAIPATNADAGGGHRGARWRPGPDYCDALVRLEEDEQGA